MAEIRRPRFLITRLSALGDCVLTLPVLCALRRHFPHAHIAWLVQPESAPLLQNHPDLSEVILVKRGWLKSPQEIRRIRHVLREREFDAVIDPQSLTKSSLAGWLSGCRRRIGLARPNGREAAMILNNTRVLPATHVVRRYLSLLEPLGIQQPATEFRILPNPAAAAAVGGFVEALHLHSGFVVLNPGAGWPSKRWPADRFAVVAQHLAARFGIRSVVNWHGTHERSLAEEVVRGSQGAAVPAPRLNLPELTELLRAALFFVGPDTGPLHLAAAVGTHCIGMFGTTRCDEIGPAEPGHILVQEYYQSGTTRQRRAAKNDAMAAIRVEHIVAACESLVGRDIAPVLAEGSGRGLPQPSERPQTAIAASVHHGRRSWLRQITGT